LVDEDEREGEVVLLDEDIGDIVEPTPPSISCRSS
jgi:hypothetical protein